VALQGTIGDFGLPDIFQLIGLQRKSGVLTLERERDRVEIRFIDGCVVGADDRGQRMEDLLGTVLVQTGRISEAQRDAAIQVQRRTLQRLGYVLVADGAITESELREALQAQVTRIVYRTFRWRSGSYRFEASAHVDAEDFAPIGAESILMEGARMVDEWPILERKISSDRFVPSRTTAGEALLRPVRSIVEHDPPEAPVVDLPPAERDILRMVDGTATVQDIVHRSGLGEFDTYRVLCDLMGRGLVSGASGDGIPTREGTAPTGAPRMAHWIATAVLVASSALAVLTLPANRFVPWRSAAVAEHSDRLRAFASRSRLEHIERAIQAFYLDTGGLPDDLAMLAALGFLREEDVRDPWGRPYLYRVDPDGYTVAALDEHGLPRPDLARVRPTPSRRRLVLRPPGSGPS